ncbi:hypothetical protein F5Y17DRAFT_341060 [Xylariaceae sp. FL0594]|nr:hypothetical protein F5Y17DRAFT_341060 [Xylariaceae sp. FL0594]
MKGWLGLLPTESHYLSVVCGGLKLIINAAARIRRVDQEILDALCKIPLTISSAQRVLNIFKDSQQLKLRSKALYQSVLGGLGHMLEYLKRSTVEKALVAGLRQQSFESKLLDEWIANMDTSLDAFNEEVELCHKEALHKLRKMGEEDANVLKDQIDQLSRAVEAARQEGRRSHNALAERMRMLAMSNVELSAKVRLLVEDFKHLMTAKPKAFEHAYHLELRLDEPDGAPLKPVERRAPVTSTLASERTISDTHKQRQTLLSRLDYDPDAVAADLKINYRLGSSLLTEDQERSLCVSNPPTSHAGWNPSTPPR